MVELECVVTGVEGNAALLKSNIPRLPPFPGVDIDSSGELRVHLSRGLASLHRNRSPQAKMAMGCQRGVSKRVLGFDINHEQSK